MEEMGEGTRNKGFSTLWIPVDIDAPSSEYLLKARTFLPIEWKIKRNTVWYQCDPIQEPKLPEQGWKIHVSSSIRSAPELLEAVLKVVTPLNVSLKFAVDEHMLRLMNSDWDRSGAGKFITIYPSGESECSQLLEKLELVLRNYEGPHILSDRRYLGCAVLHYRYGGILPESRIEWNGKQRSIIHDQNGLEVEDKRNPWFELPPWIKCDPFLKAKTVRQSTEFTNSALLLNKGRYRIEYYIQQATKGGVYYATDLRTEEKVVIKEARPFAREEKDGRDARDALDHEFEVLRAIESTGIGPRPIELFSQWQHKYLVEEYIFGQTLLEWGASEGPLLWRDKEGIRGCLEIWYQLAQSLSQLHSLGIVFGDLSVHNVLVVTGSGSGEHPNDMDVSLRMIDFESALFEAQPNPLISVRTLGFASPERRAGRPAVVEDDLYSFGAIMLAMVFPLNGVSERHPQEIAMISTSVCSDARLPNAIAELIVELRHPNPDSRPQLDVVIDRINTASRSLTASNGDDLITPTIQESWDLDSTIENIVSDMQTSSDLYREDRLFPGDWRLHETNPLSIAYGAIGVLLTLNRIEQKFDDRLTGWVASHNINPDLYAPGLYVGLSGIAWGLWDLGHREYAISIFDLATRHPLLGACMDMYHGLAGFGVTCLHFWKETEEDRFLEHAVRAGEAIIRNAKVDNRGKYYWPAPDGKINIGYGFGSSGIAQFLLYLSLASGNKDFLAAGSLALEYDIERAIQVAEGVKSFNPSVDMVNVVHPYFMSGSAGVGSVLLRFLAMSQLIEKKGFLTDILGDCHRKYTILPGITNGVAGLGMFVLDCAQFFDSQKILLKANTIRDGLMIHAFRTKHGLGFSGNVDGYQTFDLASGSSGILLFLDRLRRMYRGKTMNAENPLFFLDELLPCASLGRQYESLRCDLESVAEVTGISTT